MKEYFTLSDIDDVINSYSGKNESFFVDQLKKLRNDSENIHLSVMTDEEILADRVAYQFRHGLKIFYGVENSLVLDFKNKLMKSQLIKDFWLSEISPELKGAMEVFLPQNYEQEKRDELNKKQELNKRHESNPEKFKEKKIALEKELKENFPKLYSSCLSVFNLGAERLRKMPSLEIAKFSSVLSSEGKFKFITLLVQLSLQKNINALNNFDVSDEECEVLKTFYLAKNLDQVTLECTIKCFQRQKKIKNFLNEGSGISQNTLVVLEQIISFSFSVLKQENQFTLLKYLSFTEQESCLLEKLNELKNSENIRIMLLNIPKNREKHEKALYFSALKALSFSKQEYATLKALRESGDYTPEVIEKYLKCAEHKEAVALYLKQNNLVKDHKTLSFIISLIDISAKLKEENQFALLKYLSFSERESGLLGLLYNSENFNEEFLEIYLNIFAKERQLSNQSSSLKNTLESSDVNDEVTLSLKNPQQSQFSRKNSSPTFFGGISGNSSPRTPNNSPLSDINTFNSGATTGESEGDRSGNSSFQDPGALAAVMNGVTPKSPRK